MPPKPIHTRDKNGRHRVDLKQIQNPILRWGIPIAVLVFIVGVAIRFGRGQVVDDAMVAPWIPYIGGLVVLIGLIGTISKFRNRK
jgi:hypothetical protein